MSNIRGQSALGYIHASVSVSKSCPVGKETHSRDGTFLAEIDVPYGLGRNSQLVMGINNHHVGSYYWARSVGMGWPFGNSDGMMMVWRWRYGDQLLMSACGCVNNTEWRCLYESKQKSSCWTANNNRPSRSDMWTMNIISTLQFTIAGLNYYVTIRSNKFMKLRDLNI